MRWSRKSDVDRFYGFSRWCPPRGCVVEVLNQRDGLTSGGCALSYFVEIRKYPDVQGGVSEREGGGSLPRYRPAAVKNLKAAL